MAPKIEADIKKHLTTLVPVYIINIQARDMPIRPAKIHKYVFALSADIERAL